MIHHKLRLLRELPTLVIISRLPNGIAFLHLRGLAALGSDALAADPSSKTVAVADFIEELAVQFRLESGVAEVAHAENLFVLVWCVEMWAATCSIPAFLSVSCVS